MQRREADKPLDYRISRISFIGDLLSPQALLLIVLLAVLLSLSLTILKSGLQHFDWYLPVSYTHLTLPTNREV